ncbi:MAG: DUF3098 domain-containing protein [Bacteroidia bacterium]|nr:DUF3098 domain-containing protein [Bacteroidia bacterium]
MSKPNVKTTNSLNITFSFGKENYILMIAGLVVIIVGLMLMSGGAGTDPNVFNEEVFSTRRVTVAPMLCLLGYVIEIAAILYKSKEK